MISLIATIFNERDNAPQWLESLFAQSEIPDEIVIVDGGSTDGTWEWLMARATAEPRLKVLQKKSNISQGRNVAIAHASGDVIVVTDAGCVYDADWFKRLSVAMRAEGAQFAATAFGPNLKKKDRLLLYLIAAATTPAPAEFARDWLPSSRSVAFTKKLWESVGGYPEWIPICEDIIFDLKIKKKGVATRYVRTPLVFWRPRLSLQTYFKQLYKYTKSDGHGKLWLRRQLIRYGVYAGAITIFVFAALDAWWLLAVLFVAGLGYMYKFLKRLVVFAKGLSLSKRVGGFLVLPFIIAFGDIAKMCGWPVGVYERLAGMVKFEAY